MSVILPFQAGQTSAAPLRRHDWRPLYWLAAAILLLFFQIWSETLPLFAFLVFVFGVLTYLAVRAVGGLRTLMGICVVVLALQNVLISQVVKVFFWQPADKPLIRPIETIGVYCLTMAGIGLAGVAWRKLGFPSRKPLFLPELNPQRLMWMAVICTVFSVIQLLGANSSDADTGRPSAGGLHGFLASVNYLPPLAVVAGTASVILASQGRRSFGLVTGVAMVLPSAAGIITANRHTTIEALVMYFVTCWAFRFRFRPIHYGVLLAGWYVATFIVFPYALYARDFVRTRDMEANVSKATTLLLDMIANPIKYQEKARVRGPRYKFLYYDGIRPTLERFSVIVIADAIVDATLRGGTTEMDTITPAFQMALPRFLVPDKPSGATTLARREPGIVGKHDTTTGVTTGFACDAFSCFGWPGALILPFLVSLLLFSTCRVVFDNRLWYNVFALSWLPQLTYGYSEQTLSTLIITALQGPVVFGFVLLVINWLINLAMLTQRRLEATRRRATVGPGATAEGQLLGTRG